jgi:hypothetical protein
MRGTARLGCPRAVSKRMFQDWRVWFHDGYSLFERPTWHSGHAATRDRITEELRVDDSVEAPWVILPRAANLPLAGEVGAWLASLYRFNMHARALQVAHQLVALYCCHVLTLWSQSTSRKGLPTRL